MFMYKGDLAYLHVIVRESLTHDVNIFIFFLFMVEVQSKHQCNNPFAAWWMHVRDQTEIWVPSLPQWA